MAITSQGSELQAAPYKDVEVLVVYVVIHYSVQILNISCIHSYF